MATRTGLGIGKQLIGHGKHNMTNCQYRCLSKCVEISRPVLCVRSSSPALLQCKCPPPGEQQQRGFFLPKFPTPFPAKIKSEVFRYAEQRILGFSMQQMYDVVSDVEQYEHYVPWCIRSTTHDHHDEGFRCTFTVGFPPVLEKYSSEVTTCEPRLVKSVSTETKLFRHLVTTWHFSPGYKDNPDTCTLDYKVSFQFHSMLYTRLAQVFFDQIVHTMVDSFLRHAQTRYGRPVIAHTQKKVVRSTATN